MGSKTPLVRLAILLALGSAGCASRPDACSGRQGCGSPSAESAGTASVSKVSADSVAGGPSVLTRTGDDQRGALGVRFQDAQGLALDALVLACAQCIDIEAVVHGGNPPYALEWDDGSTQATRHVCAGAAGTLSLRVSDTPIKTAEFEAPAENLTVAIDTHEVACADDGMCAHGPGSQTPQSGHYDGDGTYVCDNDMNAQTATLINHLDLALDFDIDPSADEQRGRAFLQWGLVVIAGQGELRGALECGGVLRASLQEGTWGVPGTEPMSLIPAGMLSGEFIARATNDPDAISGSWTWTSMTSTGDYGNTCNGTYEARRVP